MSKQTILERAEELAGQRDSDRIIRGDVIQATEERFQAVEDRCDTLLDELKNTVDAGIKVARYAEALESRLNDLSSHTAPSLGLVNRITTAPEGP